MLLIFLFLLAQDRKLLGFLEMLIRLFVEVLGCLLLNTSIFVVLTLKLKWNGVVVVIEQIGAEPGTDLFCIF